MSDIQTYLENILKARYGKDVRQSIHDGIKQCYEDGKAGAVDLVARQEIEELKENIGGATEEQIQQIETNKTDIANHKKDTTVHVTSAEKETWNKSSQDLESGYYATSEKVSKLSEEIANYKYELTDEEKQEISDTVKAEVPLVKVAEQPTFVNSVDEMTDTSKAYLMPDGYLYGYREVEPYNLLKLSEVSYKTRLQNDVAGTTTSNINNLVTGWIPCEYEKWYCPSVLVNGVRLNNWGDGNTLMTRLNVKLSDGTIVYYNNNDFTWRDAYTGTNNDYVIKIIEPDAVAMMIQFYCTSDISTEALFGAYKPMVVEGNTQEDAYNKATSYDYSSGDAEKIVEWYNTEQKYNQPADYEEEVLELEKEVSNLKDAMANQTNSSPYYRDVNFGVLPFNYYQGVADSYENSAFGWNTKYADFIALWKSLVADHSGYVTETALGNASDGQTIYLYDFKPVTLSNQDKPIPKIIIIGGQHGGETCNIFGLYYFVNNLLNRWNKHSSLEYLRNHVELMIIPVLNTYGFDNQSYKNANGVNLNRNYDSEWELVADTTSSQYGGAEPFDQTETQIVRDLLLSNKDAVLVIDSHVNGGGKVAEYSDINYYGISESTDVYFNRMVDAVAHNLSSISANFNLDYELGEPNTIFGFLNHSDGNGILRNWARDKNFVSVLVEGFGGFPNGTSYASEVFKANEEIIVNFLITAMNYLAK